MGDLRDTQASSAAADPASGYLARMHALLVATLLVMPMTALVGYGTVCLLRGEVLRALLSYAGAGWVLATAAVLASCVAAARSQPFAAGHAEPQRIESAFDLD